VTHMARRRGFTLIELMIVMAVTVILLAAVFTVNFRITGLWAGERGRSELQQNFRFATDRITTTVRQATAILQPSALDPGNPARTNVLSDVLEFEYVPDPSAPDVRARVTYSRSGTGPYYIEETVKNLATNEVTTRHITESIRSLAAAHFIRTGPRIIVVMVAQYSLLGSVKTISYTTQTYVRTVDPYEG
jgi:prepilin-type N-terminal cleavage/methylation domain-containing protein